MREKPLLEEHKKEVGERIVYFRNNGVEISPELEEVILKEVELAWMLAENNKMREQLFTNQ